MQKPLLFLLYFILFSFSPALFALIYNSNPENPAVLTQFSIQSSGHTQIIFNFNQKVKDYRIFSLSHPARLVIDIANAQYGFKTGEQSVDLSNTDILRFRHGVQQGHDLRIVFDLKQAVHFSTENTLKFLHDKNNPYKNFQLIINLDNPQKQTVKENAKKQKMQKMPEIPAASSPLPDIAPAKAGAAFIKPALKKSIFTVAIDAGHGGKDPGAQGLSGTQEKDVTFLIAKDLSDLINQHPGMKAVMTRKDDDYVGLRKRLILARKAKSDIFIAIHADAFNHPYAKGASVFALSLHGSTSEAALWLAKKENYSELSGIRFNQLQTQDAVVRSVLIDLAQTASIAASLQLGQAVIRQLGSLTDLHRGSVEQAPFMVLKSPDIPSILVETGFMTNPDEENRLKTQGYQKKIAQALMSGIQTYYRNNVPRHLSLALSDT